jgi:hypothetical protein
MKAAHWRQAVRPLKKTMGVHTFVGTDEHQAVFGWIDYQP